jgi:Homeodomain-like domain
MAERRDSSTPGMGTRRAPSERQSGVRTQSRRKRTKIGPRHVTYALAAHEVGHSLREIAQALGVGVATVDRMLRHPRGVDGPLLDRLLALLRCGRALQMAGLLVGQLDRGTPRMMGRDG